MTITPPTTPAHSHRPYPPSAGRLRPQDLGGLASVGLRTRKLRASLSALGIAIGVAAIVAVLGLSASSSAGLLAEISKLGTNLLTVTNGQSLTGGTAELPEAAPGMVAELPGVTTVQYTGALDNVSAYRSPYIPAIDTNALSVDASSLGLPAAVGTSVAQGTYLNAATQNEPVAVLGYQAAQRLGIDRIWPGEKIWVGGMWFYLAGILNSAATYAPEIDSSVLIGFPAAQKYLGFDGRPTELYVRTQNNQSVTNRVDGLLAYQADPEDPTGAAVSQPSSALTAQADAAGAFNTLFLGLGAVALLVGAVGVANIMIISVLERRQEIGLRRALGATRGQIRIQFLSEAVLLSLIGGAVGVITGVISTAVYAHTKGWAIVIPPEAWAGGLAAALAIGAIAGLLPAIRAARLSPTEALWSL
jgi:putative ABC transport system permease protein